MPRGVDIEVVFDRFIGDGDELSRLQSLLARLAPDWWEGAHIHISSERREPIEVDAADGLRRAVMLAALERGHTYQEMVGRHGAGDERRLGAAEVRGQSSALTVVVAIDERPLSLMRDATLLLGNRVSIQVRRRTVNGARSDAWAEDALRLLGLELEPVWGRACATEEYQAKVMGEFPGGSRGAVGRDFARFLPGLFWLNLFGGPYIDLIGSNRLTSLPAAEVTRVGTTVLLKNGDDPEDWRSDAYRSTVAAVGEHLGADLFFDSSAAPDRATRAPEWERWSSGQTS